MYNMYIYGVGTSRHTLRTSRLLRFFVDVIYETPVRRYFLVTPCASEVTLQQMVIYIQRHHRNNHPTWATSGLLVDYVVAHLTPPPRFIPFCTAHLLAHFRPFLILLPLLFGNCSSQSTSEPFHLLPIISQYLDLYRGL